MSSGMMDTFTSSLLPFSMSSSSLSPFPSTTVAAHANNTDCPMEDATQRLSLAAVYALFFIFGLIGNLFALWVFLFLHSSRNSVRVFLINCAVADLVLLACLPFRVFYHMNENQWVLGRLACKLVGNLFYMNMYISILLLGLISLDRFWKLSGKGRARRGIRMTLWGRRQPWSWVGCGALWGFSILGLVPMITTAEDTESNHLCFEYRKRRNKATGKAYFNGIIVVLFWFVFVMMVVSYAKIALRLLRVSRDKPDLPNAQRYKRTAKKSFFVLFVFTVCFGPYHAFRPYYILSQLSDTESCDHQRIMHMTNEVMLLFSAFNSCLDPIMYFLLSGSVRKAAIQALGRRFSTGLQFPNDVTTNSSTMEFRRTSAPMALPDSGLNGDLLTPGTRMLVPDSTLRCTTTAESGSTET
ncbi:probable G-protein coupled receptor 34 [Gouania willdenowi]|uniref:Probable G-protein coupled receptor 34 n=1 Tax=Gouania willdenowi TaxID=441366 RepID=A0A8C5NHC8_GOUWI|nr:probable G-protein coupled receptor 34 [Gouania willdenowi]